MTNTAYHVKKFFDLAKDGKRAALDVNLSTGDIVCMFSKNINTKAEGDGTPSSTMSDAWKRVATCNTFAINF